MTLGIEVGSLGCFQNGGFWTFNHSVSMAMQVLYYPFESKGDISNDDSVKMANKSSGSLYLIGHTGFAKITHFQRSITNVTYSMDVLEVGGGAGYGYRLLKNTALGIEGTFMTGVVLSDATSGSANSFNVSTSLTIYL